MDLDAWLDCCRIVIEGPRRAILVEDVLGIAQRTPATSLHGRLIVVVVVMLSRAHRIQL